jgi:hypothetical protein
MGRIADSALALLAAGPLTAHAIGAALARDGVTRSRDPGAAVRRATIDDPRVVRIADGRLASVAQALSGVELSAVVGADECASAELEVEPDLAPLALLGIGPSLPLPGGLAPGDTVRVRIERPLEGAVALGRGSAPSPRPADEEALVATVGALLARARARTGELVPPIVHLGTVAATVAATRPDLLRVAGRPLSAVLADAGYETHLGWVGPAGTAWGSLTDEEIDALEGRVAELLTRERTLEAAAVQSRLLAVARRHLPERAPRARRQLARILARAGHADGALEVLGPGIATNDPGDLYEAAVIAYRRGDEVSARRWAATGSAHAAAARRDEVGSCLADIAHDLDAQAAFLRLRLTIAGDGGDDELPGVAEADRIARGIAGLSRSYLVEALVEEIVAQRSPDEIATLIGLLGEAGDDGRQACLALSAILSPGQAAAAREAAGPTARPRRAAVAGLLAARPVAAWATSPIDAPDQQQVVITLGKEAGRVSPLVVLVDLEDLGGAVKDAFFLPDMIEARMRRELLAPMEQVGLAGNPVDLHEAIELVQAALDRTALVGWRIPSLRHQPVLDRIERWLMRPRRGGTGRHPVPGS